VTAIGQDLTVELFGETPNRGFKSPALSGKAEARVGQRDDPLQARQTVPRTGKRPAQISDLPRKAAQEPAVEMRVAFLKNERGVRQPGDDPARDALGTPRE
jgi:hypothetical protein